MKTKLIKQLTLSLASLGLSALLACSAPPPAKDARALASYYLKNYSVGMKWDYAIGLAQIGVSFPGRKDMPASLSLPWGLELTEMTKETSMKKVLALIGEKDNLGHWLLEVKAVEPEQVTIRSELISNSEHITAVPAETKAYTPKTIGELYTSVLQLAPAKNRSLSFVKSNVERPLKGNSQVKITGDQFEGEYKTGDATYDTEDVTLWMSAEKGLIEKQVSRTGDVNDVRPRTTMALRLQSFSGL